MDSSKAKIPDEIWRRVPKKNGDIIVALRTSSGKIIKPVLISQSGVIMGLIVGGQDGIRPIDPLIRQEEIEAIRIVEGILGCIGLTRWRTIAFHD